MRASLATGLLLLASTANADWPAREVDRPLVLDAGTTELSLAGDVARAAHVFDEDSRARGLPDGGELTAATVTVAGRYALFQGAEVWFHAPYVARLEAPGTEPVSGSGRASFGARYEVKPSPLTFVAATAGIVLPSTSRRLRTAPDGTLVRDHLAVRGAAAFKQVLLDATAAWGTVEIVFPFANEDDDEAERDPPATYRVSAGSTFQIDSRFFVEAGAAFTRTNRDRIAGAVVAGSDQYRVELEPVAGAHLHERADARAWLSIPVAGKNTPQSWIAGGELRVRF